MAFGDNSKLVTSATQDVVANNGTKETLANAAGATAFSFTNAGSGLTGDDTIANFASNDSILNYRAIFDGNKDKIIEFGANGMLDIDRTTSKNAGADQIKLNGLVSGALRYLGDKEGQHVYADASVRLAGLIEGTVGDDLFNAGTGARSYFYDTALGLNLGGDVITGFGADDRIVTTTALFNDGGSARKAVELGDNGVFDLSGVDVNTSDDDGADHGGQIQIGGVSGLYLQGATVVNGVTYYSYGAERPPGNEAPVAPDTGAVTTLEDTASVEIDIGASDPDGDVLTYAVKAGKEPAKGSVAFDQATGTFVYTPDADENGADEFTILITDGNGGETEQKVSVTITPVQDVIAPVNLDDVAAGVGGFKILGETSLDLAGYSVSAAGDVNGDGLADVIVGAHGNSSDFAIDNGAAYVVFGKAGNTTVDLDNVAAGVGGFKILGESGLDYAGYSVSRAGDVNNDGLEDLIVGAYGNSSDFALDNGAAYVVFGKAGTATVDLDNVASGTGGFKILGESSFDYAGYSVSTAGDVNNDGYDDLIVGAYGNSSDGTVDNGAAYVVFGKAGTATVDLDSVATGAGGFKILGESLLDYAGYSVSTAGDVNGDGLADLIVGAQSHDGGGIDRGAAYVVFGKAGTSVVDLDTVAAGTGGFKILGQNSLDNAGISVASAGDVNGDGLADLAVGAVLNSDGGEIGNGAAYVVFGKAGGSLVDLDDVAAGTGGFKIIGETGLDNAALSVSSAGDVNGDGLADLIVGARGNDNSGAIDNGAAYVVFGKSGGGVVNLDDVAAGVGGFKILGETGLDLAGHSVSAAGDVNNDGLADLLVGAQGNSSDGALDNGAAYVIFGSTDWLI